METFILTGIGVIVVLLLLLLMRKPPQGGEVKMEAILAQRFLEFQQNIHREMDESRSQMEESRTVIDRHALKTMENIQSMGTTIAKIIQQKEEAQKLGQSLRDLLQGPKLRGSYGETILEEMLDKVLPRGIWEKQYCIDGQERVDAVIRFKDVVVPVDAKFPRDAYQRYLAADTPVEKSKFWKEHEAAVKTQIKSIAGKYIKPEKGTTDFALMFIPSEAVYYETIAEKNYLGEPSDLCEFAQGKKVIPVSPNTFYAFLQIVLMGIRNIKMIRNAKVLQENLSRLQRSFEFFYNKYDEIGKSVTRAAEAYRIGDGHIQGYKRQLESTLQFEGLNEEPASSSEQSHLK